MKTLIALLAGLLLVASSYWSYRGLTVFRSALRDYAATPDDLNESTLRSSRAAAAATQTVTWILADGSRQRAFYLPPRNGAVIVYAHGSPGAGSGLLPEALAMAEHGFGAVLLDLPGYGGSEGSRDWGPSFQAAIRSAVDFAIRQPGVDPRRIGGFGYSMGGCAMARAAAGDDRIAGLVLLSTYTNVSDQLHAQYRGRVPALGYFALAAAIWSGVPVAQMDTRAALRRLGRRPVFVIAGGADAAIPRHMADELQQAAANADLWLVEGVGHTGFAARLGAPYFARLREFWGRALSGKSVAAAR